MSLALLLGGVNAACAPPPPAPAAHAPLPAAGSPEQVWQARAGRRFTGRLVVAGGTIYAGSVDRKVYALDLGTGQTRWSSRLGGLISGGVLVANDTVWAASGRPEGKVYALAAGTGQRIWRTGTGPVGAPLSLVDGVLVALTQRGEALGLDPANGTIRWRRRVGFARIPAVAGDSGTLIVATVDSLFRLSAQTGRVVRRARTPGAVVSPWLAHGNVLVAGTTDSTVVAIDPAAIQPRWQVRLDAPVLGTPAAQGDTVYAASRRGTLYRITLDPTPLATPVAELGWAVTAPVTMLDGLVLLGGADGTLRALGTDGVEAWRLQLRWPVDLGPLPLHDGLLAAGGAGDLHRYRR